MKFARGITLRDRFPGMVLLLVAALPDANWAFADVRVGVNSGKWTEGNTWNMPAGQFPGPEDTARISAGSKVLVDRDGIRVRNITIAPGGVLILPIDTKLLYSGKLQIRDGRVIGMDNLIPEKTIWYVRPERDARSSGSCLEGGIFNGRTAETAFDGLNNVDWDQINENDELVLVGANCAGVLTPFSGHLMIGASGKPGYPITIRSDNRIGPAIIQSMRTPAISNHKNTRISNVVIRNISIDQCKKDNAGGCDYGRMGIRLKDVERLLIDNVRVSHAFSGILIIGADNTTVRNSIVTHVFDVGIGFYASSNLGGDSSIENNKIMYSSHGDGISLHERKGNELGNNYVISNNTISHASEEGVDVTSGTGIRVEGNTTYNNGKAAVIAHSARDVTFKDNFSYEEGGIQIINKHQNSKILVANNMFDTLDSDWASTCFWVTRNHIESSITIVNNTCLSGSRSFKQPALHIESESKGSVVFDSNVVYLSEDAGYLARLPTGLEGRIIIFRNNLWHHPVGKGANSFCIWDPNRGCIRKYTYDEFSIKKNVSGSKFGKPVFKTRNRALKRIPAGSSKDSGASIRAQ